VRQDVLGAGSARVLGAGLAQALGSQVGSPNPLGPVPPSPGLGRVGIAELAVAALFTLFGVRSLARWMRRGFRARTAGESVLFALHVTARVGMWFAFAGFFAGYALVDEPQSLRWYVMVPLSLAAVQFLTALVLGRGATGEPADDEDGQPG
jgi:hypothetical protein